MAELQFHRALESIWTAIDHANRYIVQTAPFTLFKDPAQRMRVGEVLHHLLEAIRQLARLLEPFMPNTSKELQRLLGLKEAMQHIAFLGASVSHRVIRSTVQLFFSAH